MNAIRVIHTSNEISEQDWSRFVLENKDGNIFQTPEMYRVFFDTEHYEPFFTALVNENGEILAIMLGALIEEPGRFTRLFSRRIVVYGGPLITENGNQDYLLRRILEAHNENVKKRAVFTEIRNLVPRDELQPQFELVGYKYIDHLNTFIDLTSGTEKLWENLQAKKRQGIRKAIKSGLTACCLSLNDLDEFYLLIQDTYALNKIPCPPKSLFKSVLSKLKHRDFVKTLGVRYQEKIIAVLVNLIYRDTIYAWYCGGNREYSRHHCNEFAFWTTIKWGVDNGFSLFDFGGAGRREEEYGVRDFKERLGGVTKEMGRFVYRHCRLRHKIATHGFKIWRFLQ